MVIDKALLRKKVVECCVAECSAKLLVQNYASYLKSQHPNEDCSDLRPKNQPTLFNNKRQKNSRNDCEDMNATSLENNNDDKSIISENNISDENVLLKLHKIHLVRNCRKVHR